MHQSGHQGALLLPLLCKHVRGVSRARLCCWGHQLDPDLPPPILWFYGERCKISPFLSPAGGVGSRGQSIAKSDGAREQKILGAPPHSALPVWLLWLLNLSSVKGKASSWLCSCCFCKVAAVWGVLGSRCGAKPPSPSPLLSAANEALSTSWTSFRLSNLVKKKNHFWSEPDTHLLCVTTYLFFNIVPVVSCHKHLICFPELNLDMW